jgi:ATP-dependent DNA helicase DinG
MEADVIVINHHLFFSDQALKQEGFGELLPDVDVLIFDEAHQLPDIAANFFSRAITKRQLDRLVKDIVEAQIRDARESRDIHQDTDRFQKTVDDFRLVLGRFSSRGEWVHICHAPQVKQALGELDLAYQALYEKLDSISVRGKDLLSCLHRLTGFRQTLDEFQHPEENLVSWYEWNEHSFRLMLSPVDVSDQFNEQLTANPCKSVIFTSATLSSNDSFAYFTHRLGLDEIDCKKYPSPFDYQKQALLYLPNYLPDPSSDEFPRLFAEECAMLIRATEGNCFILFTSYRMLSLTSQLLKTQIGNPLFIQGEKQRSELLQAYLKTEHAVLLGTSSFWEGVDVKGDKLKLVIIDKLPFRSPGDPVYKQRLNLVNKQGGNAFTDVQVPEATISLKQGVGRLIRDIHDYGIVMIADRRLTTKAYGKNMLDSLPPMKVTSERSQVFDFALKF